MSSIWLGCKGMNESFIQEGRTFSNMMTWCQFQVCEWWTFTKIPLVATKFAGADDCIEIRVYTCVYILAITLVHAREPTYVYIYIHVYTQHQYIQVYSTVHVTYLFVYRTCACLSICVFVCVSIYLSICLSAYLSICLSVEWLIYLSVYLIICPLVSLYICLLVYLHLSLSVKLSIYVYTHLSVYLIIYLYI